MEKAENTENTAQVVKFSVTDAAIAQMKSEYMGLSIAGADDKNGFELVHRARMTVKEKRVDVEKTRKSLNESALEWQRKVNAEAKRITEMLAPVENHLKAQEEAYEAERERIRLEVERKVQEKTQARVAALITAGMQFNGAFYFFPGSPLSNDVITLTGATDEEFDQFLAQAKVEQARVQAEADRRAKEEADRLEAERLKKEAEEKAKAEELARVKAEQDRIRAEQEEAARVLQAEREKLEADKKRVAESEAAAAKHLQDIIAEQVKEEEALKAERAKLEAEKAEAAEKIRKENEALAAKVRELEATKAAPQDVPAAPAPSPAQVVPGQPKASVEPKLTAPFHTPADLEPDFSITVSAKSGRIIAVTSDKDLAGFSKGQEVNAFTELVLTRAALYVHKKVKVQ